VIFFGFFLSCFADDANLFEKRGGCAGAERGGELSAARSLEVLLIWWGEIEISVPPPL